MTREQAFKALRGRASKEQLREALAWCLGEPYTPKERQKPETLFSRCRDMFCAAYERQTELSYCWQTKDGVALSRLISQIEKINGSDEEAKVVITFDTLLQKLPHWYRENAFSVTVINSKFNEIVSQIKQQNGQKQTVSTSYKEQVLRDLCS